jgi:ABC-type transport system involved in multi-copper enzyme maturation permease subunit
MMSLIRREFAAYFQSPIAYVVLGVFLVVTGHLFYLTTLKLTDTTATGTEYPMQEILGDERFWLVFLFIPPLLTMRSFAEERGSGTLEMLMTAPIRDWQVVLGKFIACGAFYKLMWLPTLVYLPVLCDFTTTWNLETGWTLYGIVMVVGIGLLLLLGLLLVPFGAGGWLLFFTWIIGLAATGVGIWGHYTKDTEHLVLIKCGIDPLPVLTSYLGVFFAGGMFLALGMYVSSLVKSQMVAALVSLILSLLFIVTGFWQPELDTSGLAYRIIYFVSVPMHFARDFTRGVIDTRVLILYSSVMLFFLFVTVRSLENRRWK